jgi:predicted AAA+ superfamily ATPase
MTKYTRKLNLPELLKKKSFFLLGPRATGKSFLVREQLAADAIVINLLDSQLYLRLSASPWELEGIIAAELLKKPSSIIVIDEIQKVPSLLDEVHRLIEEKHWRFLLTGSSARKLKHGHANLLAGRAWTANLFPLSYSEIPDFDLERFLRFGGLPSVYLSAEPGEELNAYVRTYLYEEIQAEGLVRKLPQFSRFLLVAALANGQTLNFAEIAQDAQVPASTIQEHYRILEDTLIGFTLPPWLSSKKRKSISAAKFYLFDTGVTHALARTATLDRNSDLYGRSFEQWIAMELRAYLSYQRKDDELCFWRSVQKDEVDFVIGDHTAIEVKATKKIVAKDVKGLRVISEESKFRNLLIVTQDKIETLKDGVRSMHWKTFLDELWSGKLF